MEINFKAPLEEFDLLLPTFQHMINSFKIGEGGSNNIDTRDESRSVINTINDDAIKKYSKIMKMVEAIKRLQIQ